MECDFEKITRVEIRGLPVYSPGMDIDDVRRRYGVADVIKLASNENPLGPSQLAVEAVREAVNDISLYPDGACTALRERLSEKLGVPPECFIFGNGTDEIIDFIFFAFFDCGDVAVMGDPTFSSYFLSGMTMGATVRYVSLRDHSHHIEEMLAAVDERTKAVFVGTPHNPTGTICTTGELEQMLNGLPPEVLLIWDEAYCEYVDDPTYPDSVPYLANHPNLVVLRTFSKIYGLAGLRVGYGMADPSIVDFLERVRPPFNVNRLAQVGALHALSDDEHVQLSRKLNAEGKRYLANELSRLGLESVPTQANFILFRFDQVTDALSQKLLEKGIIVRDGAALGYPGHIRLTIGTREQNHEVIEAIEQIIG
ncbi:MAG TPA: histidinol-phosphate transaminase [Candidatus Anoxymicrobiaceae bacterium]